MKKLIPHLQCVTPGANNTSYVSCNPCSPDEVRGGSQCNPCNPCSPDQVRGGSQCNPCNPCSPDRMQGGSNCNPCNPCSPDQVQGGSHCNPCNPCSPDQMRGGSNSGNTGCFISSACVESMGLLDDCQELQILRAFRDVRKESDPSFKTLVEEYYRTAPTIVEEINNEVNSKEIYENLYTRLVMTCVNLLKEGRQDEAIVKYTTIFKELRDTYVE